MAFRIVSRAGQVCRSSTSSLTSLASSPNRPRIPPFHVLFRDNFLPTPPSTFINEYAAPSISMNGSSAQFGFSPLLEEAIALLHTYVLDPSSLCRGDASLSLSASDSLRMRMDNDFFPPPLETDELFLPGQDEDTSSPMLMNTKRPFQPSTIVRKRRHGFLARKATVGGRRVLARRWAKGRRRLSA